jgi:hypothetical protein
MYSATTPSRWQVIDPRTSALPAILDDCDRPFYEYWMAA